MIKLSFKNGDKNRLTRVNEKEVLLTIKKDSISNTSDLISLLSEKLPKLKKIKIDIDSYLALDLRLSNLEKELALYIVHSKYTYTPFSLKTKKSCSYTWDLEKKDQELKEIIFAYENTKTLQATPPNILNTQEFVSRTKSFLNGIENISIRVIEGEEIIKEKLFLIEAVGRGAESKGKLLLIEYKGGTGDWKALVGKGICFDTGGLNLKPGSYMSNMKFDMSGGAVSLGVVYSLAKNKSKQNLIVAIPLAENSVNSNSYRPDDVLMSRSGKSIEIENTDAEGRLVLADAISYVQETYKPSEIITIATLTGAVGYALGDKFGGAWSTSEEQWNELYTASKKAGEWIWRLPLDDSYLKELKKTSVADIRNSAKTGKGGASRAACFLKEFTANTPYIHLDIANIANCDSTGEAKAPMLRTLYFYLKK